MALASWADGSCGDIESILSNHRDFASLVRHELKRSERYCSFVSILSIFLERLNERLEWKFPADITNADDFIVQLWQAIKSAVRATDVVSSVSNDRVGLLLVETPKDGAMVVAHRLRDHLSHFFNGAGDLTSATNIKIEVGSFPDDIRSIERILIDFGF